MTKIECLKYLISSLQSKINSQELSANDVVNATKTLAGIGYKYDANLFPALNVDARYSPDIGSQPNNLAEALLWKMGKWNIYKDFVKSYSSDDPLTKKTDVVFSAFAKHLKQGDNPIYDQHTLRAMWAININLNNEEQEQCKAALVKSKGKDQGKWKATLSGSETINCYELYVRHLNTLAAGKVSKSALDKLLMPLGQALKINFTTYEAIIPLRKNAGNS